MPERERARVLDLVRTEPWARAELERVKGLAGKGDGYWSAFLYALEKDARHLPAARRWLLEYGRAGGDLGQRALQAGPEFFRGGQPWLGDVYYRTDTRALVAYDWIHDGLTAEDRATIEAGIMASARFRMRAMDRWSQTPNLVFKPTFMVAMAGLVTGDRELLDWGFSRKPGSSRGGYFHVLQVMLRDGPWGEAPIYPIAHKSLLLMLQMSRHLGLRDGQDWFNRTSAVRGSPRGLVDYYIDTAYPIERTGHGSGQIRIATYGDGATSVEGDLFLVNPAGPGLHLHDELAAALAVSGDPRYAAFLALIPGYAPDLTERPPIAEDARLPPAPSRIWPGYGLAMLRSDESPAYWTSGKAIAVLQVMSQGYGHDHRDKFAITLHGAGRLLYPDYNAVQYENPAVGWTRNSVAHNTLVVDEAETRNASPSGVRHDFTPGVKFLAISASGVFEGVDQTRALLLTPEYLLDLFHATSQRPRTYDYLLHSLGSPRPAEPARFQPSSALAGRYSLIGDARAMTTASAWSLDFVLDERTARDKEAHDRRVLEERKTKVAPVRHGPEWYAHTAAVRVTMTADADTLVNHGVDPHRVAALVVRRAGQRQTLFAAAHEPFAGGETPRVAAVTVVARSRDAALVRVDARDFTDYAAVAFGPQGGQPEHALGSQGTDRTRVAFKSYGYLRVHRDGRVAAWGGWTGFTVPGLPGSVTLNGRAVAAGHADGRLAFGTMPATVAAPIPAEVESAVAIQPVPAVARVFARDRRHIRLRVTNRVDRDVAGRIEFDAAASLSVEPRTLTFGPLALGQIVELPVTIVAADPAAGRHVLLYRIRDTLASAAPNAAVADGLPVTVGPVLEHIQRHPAPAVYRVHAPLFTAEFDMRHGLWRHLADDDGVVRLDGKPLFTFSDGEKDLLSEATKHAFTWPTAAPAALSAHTYDRARYDLAFFGDRVVVRMDPSWTQPPRIDFTVPGQWRSPEGPPRWARVVTSDGKVLAEDPSDSRSIAAAELSFPAAKWHLCFELLPARAVTLTGTSMRFSVDPRTGDRWTVGFCRPGSLETWRWKRW
jgi:hypothetical protein